MQVSGMRLCIDTINEYGSEIDPLTVELIQAATEFYTKRLLPKNIRDEIVLYIELIDDFEYHGMLINEDMFDESGELDILPDVSREFTIQINNSLPIGDALKVLAHEVVHLKQHALAELSYAIVKKTTFGDSPADPIATTWKGEPWKPRRGERVDHDSPWEQEAYGKEVGLLFQFSRYWNRKFKEKLIPIYEQV